MLLSEAMLLKLLASLMQEGTYQRPAVPQVSCMALFLTNLGKC